MKMQAPHDVYPYEYGGSYLGEKTQIDLEGFKEKLLRRTRSQTTVDTYMHGLRRFETFCQEKLGKSTQEVVDDLAGVRADVYEVLDKFAGWVASQTDRRTGTLLMPRTVHTYLEGTKKLLRYCGVDIINEKYTDRVTTPMASEIPDVPLEKPVLRKLLLSSMPMGLKVAIGIMASGGTRIGETLQLKVSDIRMDEDPVRIHLRAPTTKATREGRTDRDTFIVPEVAEMVRQYIVIKGRKPTDNLFHYTPNDFRGELKSQLKKLGLDQKLEGHRYSLVHPHVFRKYFSRLADPIVGVTARNALTGHRGYLDTYTKKPLHERQDDYRKLVPVLSVLQATSEEEERLRTVLSTMRLMGLTEAQVKKYESELRQRNLFEPDNELMQRIRDDLTGAWGLKAPNRRPQIAGVW